MGVLSFSFILFHWSKSLIESIPPPLRIKSVLSLYRVSKSIQHFGPRSCYAFSLYSLLYPSLSRRTNLPPHTSINETKNKKNLPQFHSWDSLKQCGTSLISRMDIYKKPSSFALFLRTPCFFPQLNFFFSRKNHPLPFLFPHPPFPPLSSRYQRYAPHTDKPASLVFSLLDKTARYSHSSNLHSFLPVTDTLDPLTIPDKIPSNPHSGFPLLKTPHDLPLLPLPAPFPPFLPTPFHPSAAHQPPPAGVFQTPNPQNLYIYIQTPRVKDPDVWIFLGGGVGLLRFPSPPGGYGDGVPCFTPCAVCVCSLLSGYDLVWRDEIFCLLKKNLGLFSHNSFFGKFL